VPIGRAVGAIHAIAVFEVLVVEIEHSHRVDVADAELLRKGKLCKWLASALLEEHERARCSMPRIDGEIDASGHERRAERKRASGPDA
jgi:hypothetical protein